MLDPGSRDQRCTNESCIAMSREVAEIKHILISTSELQVFWSTEFFATDQRYIVATFNRTSKPYMEVSMSRNINTVVPNLHPEPMTMM